MAPPWNTTVKSITNMASSQPNPADTRIPTSFVPPQLNGHLAVKPQELFLSMARCAALSSVSPALHAALEIASRSLLEVLVDDTPKSFDLESAVNDLVDFERTGLAGRVGAGFTDLVMMFLRYNWRDLASAQIHTSPLADFLYEGGSAAGLGAVLVEAKGSFAAAATATTIKTTAENGFSNQVDPNIGASCAAGKVIYGYAVAFGARPVSSATGSWAGIHIAEAKHTTLPGLSPVISGQPSSTSGGTPTSPGGGPAQAAVPPAGLTRVSWQTALGNFRAIAALVGAAGLYEVIGDLLLDRTPSAVQNFQRVHSGDRTFLVSDGPYFTANQHNLPQLFAIDEKVARQFLDQTMTGFVNAERAFVSLTTAPTTIGTATENEAPYVLFPDGLAMLLKWRDSDLTFPWSLNSGFGPERPSNRPSTKIPAPRASMEWGFLAPGEGSAF